MKCSNGFKGLILPVMMFVLAGGNGYSQSTEPDTLATQQQQKQKQEPPKKKQKKPIYYGGGVGMTFGDYTRISIEPLIAYKVKPALSVGGRLYYEYIKDKRYSPSLDAHNYGLSAFSRYRLVPQLYAHAEFAFINYELYATPTISNRDWIPFLFLGGGYSQQIAPNVWAYAQALVDVLQDSQSPYEDWDPFFSVGVNVGF
jgi:hypothetical protein